MRCKTGQVNENFYLKLTEKNIKLSSIKSLFFFY